MTGSSALSPNNLCRMPVTGWTFISGVRRLVVQFCNAIEDKRVDQGEFREHRQLAPYVIREITLSEHDTATSRAGLMRRGVPRKKHRRSGCHRFMQIGD